MVVIFVKILFTFLVLIGVIVILIGLGIGLIKLDKWLNQKFPAKQLTPEEKVKKARFAKKVDNIAGFIGVAGLIVVIFMMIYKVMWG